jgi:hypothetical protein
MSANARTEQHKPDKPQVDDPAKGGTKPASPRPQPSGDSPKPHGDPLRHVIEEQKSR